MPPKKKIDNSIDDILAGGKLINWYENIPKQFLDTPKNPNVKLHGLKLPFRMCVSAPSGSGKTNWLVNLIHLFCSGTGTFADITIVTRNKDEPLYNYLTSKCDQIRVVEGIHNLPILDKMDKTENHLVVCDDLVLTKDQTSIINYYIRARKLNCSIIYLSQSFFSIPSIIRKNCNYLVFLKIGGLREVKTILHDFALGVSKEQLINMYDYATHEKMNSFLIDLEANVDSKFRKNFTEILYPSQFGAFE